MSEMTLDDLMVDLYEIYEQNGCDGSIKIMTSTYGCGATSQRPMLRTELTTQVSETGEVSIIIHAEDN